MPNHAQRSPGRDPAGLTFYHADYWTFPAGDWPVYPFCVEEAVRDGATQFSETCCRFMIVNLIVDGELSYRCDGRRDYLVDAGKVFVIPQNSSYSFATTPRRHYRKLVLELKGGLLLPLCERLRLNHCRLLAPPDPTALAAAMHDLGRLLQRGNAADIPALLGRTHEFLSALALGVGDEPRESRLLALARARLESLPGDNVRVAKLAAELGVCQSTLDRLFRDSLGLTPQRYRILHRLENARYYLEHTSLSIKEISGRLGYANQLYFSNDFKKHCGVAPKHYRQRPREAS